MKSRVITKYSLPHNKMMENSHQLQIHENKSISIENNHKIVFLRLKLAHLIRCCSPSLFECHFFESVMSSSSKSMIIITNADKMRKPF